MTFDDAISEFAELLKVGSSALKALAERQTQSDAANTLSAQLIEVEVIAARLAEIGEKLSANVG